MEGKDESHTTASPAQAPVVVSAPGPIAPQSQATLIGQSDVAPAHEAQPGTVANTDTTKPPLKVSDAVAVLIVTAAAYMCVFAYEVGFCKFFGVPSGLIRPDVSTFLIYGTVALFVLTLLYQLAFALYIINDVLFESEHKRPYLRVAFPYVVILLVCLVLAWLEDFKGFTPYCLAGLTMLCLAEDFIMPLRYKILYPKLDYRFLFKFRQENTKEPIQFPLQKRLHQRGLNQLLTLFLILTWTIYISVNFGRLEARSSETFLCRDSPRKEVVLRVYGTTAITARRDDSGKMYPEFRFIKLDEGSTNEFTLKKIGKLKPQLPSQ
jgi:hypothetical protein